MPALVLGRAATYKARGEVTATVRVTLPGDIPLRVKLTAQVKTVYATPDEKHYFLECVYKGEIYKAYVLCDPEPDYVFLQFLAPYLGTFGGAGWSYGALPVSGGDFSFTYIH